MLLKFLLLLFLLLRWLFFNYTHYPSINSIQFRWKNERAKRKSKEKDEEEEEQQKQCFDFGALYKMIQIVFDSKVEWKTRCKTAAMSWLLCFYSTLFLQHNRQATVSWANFALIDQINWQSNEITVLQHAQYCMHPKQQNPISYQNFVYKEKQVARNQTMRWIVIEPTVQCWLKCPKTLKVFINDMNKREFQVYVWNDGYESYSHHQKIKTLHMIICAVIRANIDWVSRSLVCLRNIMQNSSSSILFWIEIFFLMWKSFTPNNQPIANWRTQRPRTAMKDWSNLVEIPLRSETN